MYKSEIKNNTKPEYFVNLENELRPLIDKVIKHPFLNRLVNKELTNEQLKQFCYQYSWFCGYFPRSLCSLAGQVTTDETRLPLIKNLWEEHGEGETEKCHRVLFQKFMSSLKITKGESEKIPPLKSTIYCVEELLKYCSDRNFVRGLGAMGPGTEFFTKEEYLVVVGGLKKYNLFTDDDLEFWTVHIVGDDDHYSEIVMSLVPYINTEENRDFVKEGAIKAIELEIIFWDGLQEAI